MVRRIFDFYPARAPFYSPSFLLLQHWLGNNLSMLAFSLAPEQKRRRLMVPSCQRRFFQGW
jgi:hypothetical protein